MSGIMRMPADLSHKQRVNSFSRTETCFAVSHIARRHNRFATRCSRASSPGLASSGNTTSNASPGTRATDSSPPSGLLAKVPGDWAVLAACGLALWKLSCLPPEALLVAAFWAPQIALPLHKLRCAGFKPNTALALATTFVSAGWAVICRLFVSASLAQHLGKGAELVVTLPLHLLRMLPLHSHLVKAAPKAAACLTILLSLLMPMALGVGLGYRHASTSSDRPASPSGTASQPQVPAEPQTPRIVQSEAEGPASPVQALQTEDAVQSQPPEAGQSPPEPTPEVDQGHALEAAELAGNPPNSGAAREVQQDLQHFVLQDNSAPRISANDSDSAFSLTQMVHDQQTSEASSAVNQEALLLQRFDSSRTSESSLPETNTIDQFIEEASASPKRAYLAALRTKLFSYMTTITSTSWRQAALHVVYSTSCPSQAAEIQAHLDLLQPNSRVQVEAALALAEAAVKEPSIKSLVGELGGMATLRGVLDTLLVQDPVYAAAVVAVGALCRDSPANACLLVADEDLELEDPLVLAGLASAMKGASGGAHLAAAEVQRTFKNAHHLQRALRPGKHGRDQPLSAQLVLTSICSSGAGTWGGLLPHILVNQLLASKDDGTYWWGVLLLMKRNINGFEAVRESCMPLLIDALGSQHRKVKVQKNIAWALSQLCSSSNNLRHHAITSGALPALLGLVNPDNPEAVQYRAADATRALMTKDDSSEGSKASVNAKAKAIPTILECLRADTSERVKAKLLAALEAFSPGASKKVETVFGDVELSA